MELVLLIVAALVLFVRRRSAREARPERRSSRLRTPARPAPSGDWTPDVPEPVPIPAALLASRT